MFMAIILFTTPCLAGDSKFQLSPEEIAWINENHIVRVRIGNSPPFMLTRGETRGIAIEYLTQIFKRNNIKVKYVSEFEVTWPQALDYIKQHKIVDMVPTAKITEDRKKDMIFTEEYIFAPWVIFTRTDSDFIGSIDDLNGKTVSVEQGFVMHQKLKQDYPGIHLKVVSASLENYAEIPIKDLSTGLADAYIGNLLSTTYTIQTNGYTNIKVAAPTSFDNHNQAMAIRSDWPELAGIINKTLASMTSEEHAAIRNKWLSIRYEYGINKAYVLRWVAGVAGVLLLFVLVVLLWNKRLKAEVEFRRKIEDVLRDREKLLNDVGKIAKIGGWEMDLTTRKAKWTRGTYDVVEIETHHPIPGPDEHLDYYLPEYRALVNDAMTALIEADKPMDFEARFMTAKGNIKWCRAMGRAEHRNGKCVKLFGTLQDITDRKKAEYALKENEQRYKKAQHLGKVGNWEYDLKTQNFWGSDEARRIYGFDLKSEDFTTDEVENCIPERERVHQALIDLIENNTPYDLEFEIQPFDGSKKKIIRSIAEIQKDDSGASCKVTGVIQDITRQKNAELEKQQLEQQLQHARKIEAIGTLAGGIAHDFNNILYPIIGFAEMSIEDLPKDHPVQENLDDILQGAKRARDLVKQILSFSSQKDLELKVLPFQSLIQETLKLLRSIIPSNIEIQKDFVNTEIYIFANSTEIHEVIMNVCTNAYHAMEGKGGILSITLNHSRPDPKFDLPAGEYCCLAISDTGTGIPVEIMSNIFDPYFTTKKQGKGSGLGLSVTHGIVKSYKGAIDIQTWPGKGTKVTIFLPITSRRELLVHGTEDLADKSGDERILFVDDEESVVKLGVRLLERFGYTVTGKTSSTNALEVFQANPEKFDLVITDMTMPVMLGTELSRKMLEIRKNIPILICTGFSEQVNEEKAKSFGIKGYINKPILLKELVSKVRELLDHCKRE